MQTKKMAEYKKTWQNYISSEKIEQPDETLTWTLLFNLRFSDPREFPNQTKQ